MKSTVAAFALLLAGTTALASDAAPQGSMGGCPPGDSAVTMANSPLPQQVTQCLSCHVDAAGTLNIVGVRALSALPDEWQYLFEDAFDQDGDGIAGAMRFVSGAEGPRAAKFGQTLAASRFEDFALIAAAAHEIDLRPELMAMVKASFEQRSPQPHNPFQSAEQLARFEDRGCARCHVTETFEFEGEELMPLSDFLLHDLGDGPRRTAPLWGCFDCVDSAPHKPIPIN